MRNKISVLICLLLMPAFANAAGGPSVPLDHIKTDISNKESLQRGLALYTNYCLGCHSMEYQRFERNAIDMGIPNDLYEGNLIFTDHKIGQLMSIAMPKEKAAAWFGNPPPDLTLVARLRGPEWLYTYLRSFYVDESRPWGVNNEVFKDVGMPNVLAGLQGIQRKGCGQVAAHDESGHEKRDALTGSVMTEEKCDVLVIDDGTGELTPDQFDAAIYDLVNFLEYVGEPSRLQSEKVGTYALMFMVLFFVIALMLKREYWKDIH